MSRARTLSPRRRAGRQPREAALFRLEGKTALVSGACGFLGRALVQGLLDAGARVIMMSRAQTVEEERRRYAERVGLDRITACRVDFYDRPALQAALRRLAADETVDVLVNNAYDMGPRTGFNVPAGCLEDATFSEWSAAFESMHWSVATTQILGGRMARRGRGSIINIASMYGLVAPHPALYEGTAYLNPVTYSASKAALIAFTRYVAACWGSRGVRCNAIAPGPFPNTTQPSANAVQRKDPFLDRVAARTLLGRVGRREELVGPLVFLASEASSYVTGHTLVVDGGWTVT